MVNQVIHGTYTETYDLNTSIGELSMLGIHTPQSTSLKKMFKGFFENYKKYKILGCNFNMVCASQQALDPSQIGLEAGQVDPRDVLNPILFKACTGESINALVDQIYNNNLDVDVAAQGERSVSQVLSSASWRDAYYALLADDSWRKSHPQKGLTVMGLKPMVHKVVTTQPFKWVGASAPEDSPFSAPYFMGSSDSETVSSARGMGGPRAGSPGTSATTQANPTVFVSNGLTDMPWLETAVGMQGTITNGSESQSKYGNYIINSVPRVYMGAIVLPPAILQRLFFRLQITWHVLFKDFRPAFEMGPVVMPGGFDSKYPNSEGMISGADGSVGTYFNIYHNATPESKVTNEHSSFTTTETTEVEQIMESVK